MKKERKNIRLPYWDYSAEGYYFVTICTKSRECLFGEIVNGEMMLNEMGMVANQCWRDIHVHFPFVESEIFQIMPNHIHGIIIIGHPDVGAQNLVPLREEKANHFGPQSKNLGSIIRGFKIGVKKYATMLEVNFAWQRGYYDRVIRNNDELENIRNYIFMNPEKWLYDSENIF